MEGPSPHYYAKCVTLTSAGKADETGAQSLRFRAPTGFIDILLADFKPRINAARSFAILHGVLQLRTSDRVDLDVSLGGFKFEQSAVSRARKVRVIPGVSLMLCTADDLIVYKAFASRPLDCGICIDEVTAASHSSDGSLTVVIGAFTGQRPK